MSNRPFAVFDIDGTLIRWQLYHALVDQLVRQGVISVEAYEKVVAARLLWKQRAHEEAFRDYEEELVSAYMHSLRGMEITQAEHAISAVFEKHKDRVYRYTRDLIHTLKDKNYLLFAISGSHDELVAKVAAHYGFDDFIGVKHERQEGRFTGKREATIGMKPHCSASWSTSTAYLLSTAWALATARATLACLPWLKCQSLLIRASSYSYMPTSMAGRLCLSAKT